MHRYRLNEEKAEWIIYVTDVGQQLHFDMVFSVCIHYRLPCSVSVDFLACCQHSFSSSCTYFSSFFFLASDIFFAVHMLLWSVKLTILMFMPWTKIQVLVRQWNQLSLPLFFSPLLMTGCQTCWLAFSWW